jgi:PAS domain S-box-containing protein
MLLTDGDRAIFQIFSQRAQAELERKHTEEALRQSEERLRLALVSAQLGTWDLNPVTGELKWDNGCRAMFGLSPDAPVTYEIFWTSLHPDDRDRVDASVQWSLNPASEGEYNIEYRTIGIEDGVERWVAARGKAVFNSAGTAIRFIGTVLNITEQKRVEAEREQLLQREQAAREQAEAANRIKDEFLAVLSHELRTPLNPILGWASLLQRGGLTPEMTTEAIVTIERNAKLQVQLIEDLLDISRILRGKLSLTVSTVDLSAVIAAALETVRLAAEAKSLQIQTTIAPNVGWVNGDAGRLQQVVWNLLSNAVKFTPTGGQIKVTLAQVGSDAQIQVTDNGKGIHPDFLPHVFDHFRQEDSATTRKFGGLGLGLAIVRQIVELHGGRVEAASLGEGQGAMFTVKIPVSLPSQQSQPDDSTSATIADLSGIAVLVVDDDADSREFTTFVLAQAHAIVTTAASGWEALQILAQSMPDVLVSDIGMPGMDGYMLMQQIQTLVSQTQAQTQAQLGQHLPALDRIPKAIALTAYAGEVDQQQTLAAGFQHHLAKPVTPEHLVQTIVDLVHHSPMETL